MVAFDKMTELEMVDYFASKIGIGDTDNGSYAVAFAIIALKIELSGHLSDFYEILGDIRNHLKVLADNV